MFFAHSLSATHVTDLLALGVLELVFQDSERAYKACHRICSAPGTRQRWRPVVLSVIIIGIHRRRALQTLLARDTFHSCHCLAVSTVCNRFHVKLAAQELLEAELGGGGSGRGF